MATKKQRISWEKYADVEKIRGVGGSQNLLIRCRLHFIDEVLGTVTSDEDVYRKYIASKAPDAASVEDEVKCLGVDKVMDKSITCFRRDPITGEPIIMPHMVKGFIKNAAKALKDVTTSFTYDIAAYSSRISNEVFVSPRHIKFNAVKYNDEGRLRICERPLRASTALGERIALAASEAINAGTSCDIMIECMNPEIYELVLECLDYGRYNGLGQWHNSGKGAFLWERVDKDGNCIGGNYEEFKEFLDYAIKYEEARGTGDELMSFTPDNGDTAA